MSRTLEKRPQRSLCGIFNCGDCERRSNTECTGCLGGNLSRRRRGEPTCVIYDCVKSQKIESCWQCAKSECPLEQGAVPFCVTQEHFDAARHKLEENIAWLVRRRTSKMHVPPRGALSEPRLARARWYLSVLDEMARRGVQRVCSYDLARATGVKSALVRRDLSWLGHLGTPSVGYELERLRASICEFFGLGVPCYWVGAARLEAEPSLVQEFAACHCAVARVFDPSPEYIGRTVAGLTVQPFSDLKAAAAADQVCGAILALPAQTAQAALDVMVEAGLKGILSLVSSPLAAPPHVTLQQADLPSQLFLLMARCRRQPSAE